MVKKNNINSINNEDKTNNLHFNLNLNNVDDENFKEEVLIIYDAINDGKIDLNSKEKEQLLKELDLILDHFKSSETKTNPLNSVYSNNAGEDIDLNFKSSVNINNHIALNELNDSNSDEPVYFSNGVMAEKSSLDAYDNNELYYKSDNSGKKESMDDFDDSFSVDDGGDVSSGDLSVDDALNVLIDDTMYSMDNNDYSFDSSSVDDVLIELVDDGGDVSSGDLSVDDVLIELVDDGGDVSSDVLSVDDALNDLIANYSDELAIKVENVSMQFTVSKDKIDTLKEFVIRTIKRNKSGSKIVTALKDISFEIPKGDRVGVIGFNGAGKSTLLKILAGVYDATEGNIETKGKIAPLLELGAGFDPNYTGKDNIFLNGAFLGYPEDFLKEKYDEILEFSELGDAINYHVKTYSSGMRAKLGFSIATIVEPDILILDEILSVGDIKFRKKSADKIRSLINSGITVLLVSHSVGQIRDLCNKAIWIDEGKLKMYGEVNEVCDAYVKASNNATKEQLENIKLDY